MTELKQKAEEYVESKGKEHFKKFYDEQLSIADLLKICCIEFANETTKELREENRQLMNDYEMIHNCFLINENENKQLKEQVENLQIMLQAEREVRCNTEYLKKVIELEYKNEKFEEENKKAKEIIRELCGTVRALNNPNTQLTNVDVYLADTESFLKE